ncbi:MAG: hypothetical protein BMS9Abin28_1562 [Anaerolineae bacterium]|nr:MAG: hypothetical protein BMS9Abin28_1562 [Anaerolineae bacterium]
MDQPQTATDLVELEACPICGSQINSPFESLQDGGRVVTYVLCDNCAAVYQSPRMTDETLKSYYEAEYVAQHQRAIGVTEKELRIQAGRARNLVRLLLSQMGAVDRQLDIGCSTGSLMTAVIEAYGCAAVGVEPAEIYRSYCLARGLMVVPDLAGLDGDRFDLITMAHVLEHLPDPVRYLCELRERWLTPDGALLIEVPNLFGHQSLELPHLFCFSASTLRYVLERAGYEVVQVERHGSPRSQLIPLYLTAISRPTGSGAPAHMRKPKTRTVRLRRKSGMIWNRLATRIAPGWAWLPLPEPEARA